MKSKLLKNLIFETNTFPAPLWIFFQSPPNNFGLNVYELYYIFNTVLIMVLLHRSVIYLCTTAQYIYAHLARHKSTL